MQRRDNFRIHFPAHDRPRLITGLGVFEVTDASAGGLCLRDPGRRFAGVGMVKGTLRLASGDAHAVTAVVVRLDAGSTALQLTEGPSVEAMLAEQRRLIRRYPRVELSSLTPLGPDSTVQ